MVKLHARKWDESQWEEVDWNESDWNEPDWNEADWNESEADWNEPDHRSWTPGSKTTVAGYSSGARKDNQSWSSNVTDKKPWSSNKWASGWRPGNTWAPGPKTDAAAWPSDSKTDDAEKSFDSTAGDASWFPPSKKDEAVRVHSSKVDDAAWPSDSKTDDAVWASKADDAGSTQDDAAWSSGNGADDAAWSADETWASDVAQDDVPVSATSKSKPPLPSESPKASSGSLQKLPHVPKVLTAKSLPSMGQAAKYAQRPPASTSGVPADGAAEKLVDPLAVEIPGMTRGAKSKSAPLLALWEAKASATSAMEAKASATSAMEAKASATSAKAPGASLPKANSLFPKLIAPPPPPRRNTADSDAGRSTAEPMAPSLGSVVPADASSFSSAPAQVVLQAAPAIATGWPLNAVVPSPTTQAIPAANAPWHLPQEAMGGAASGSSSLLAGSQMVAAAPWRLNNSSGTVAGPKSWTSNPGSMLDPRMVPQVIPSTMSPGWLLPGAQTPAASSESKGLETGSSAATDAKSASDLSVHEEKALEATLRVKLGVSEPAGSISLPLSTPSGDYASTEATRLLELVKAAAGECQSPEPAKPSSSRKEINTPKDTTALTPGTDRNERSALISSLREEARISTTKQESSSGKERGSSRAVSQLPKSTSAKPMAKQQPRQPAKTPKQAKTSKQGSARPSQSSQISKKPRAPSAASVEVSRAASESIPERATPERKQIAATKNVAVPAAQKEPIQLDPPPDEQLQDHHQPQRIFEVGDSVKYWSSSFNKHLKTEVVGVRFDTAGKVVAYDLAAKRGAEPAHVFPTGEQVSGSSVASQMAAQPNMAAQSNIAPGAANGDPEDAIQDMIFAHTGLEVAIGLQMRFQRRSDNRYVQGIVMDMYLRDGRPVVDMKDGEHNKLEKGVPMQRLAPMVWTWWCELLELAYPRVPAKPRRRARMLPRPEGLKCARPKTAAAARRCRAARGKSRGPEEEKRGKSRAPEKRRGKSRAPEGKNARNGVSSLASKALAEPGPDYRKHDIAEGHSVTSSKRRREKHESHMKAEADDAATQEFPERKQSTDSASSAPSAERKQGPSSPVGAKEKVMSSHQEAEARQRLSQQFSTITHRSFEDHGDEFIDGDLLEDQDWYRIPLDVKLMMRSQMMEANLSSKVFEDLPENRERYGFEAIQVMKHAKRQMENVVVVKEMSQRESSDLADQDTGDMGRRERRRKRLAADFAKGASESSPSPDRTPLRDGKSKLESESGYPQFRSIPGISSHHPRDGPQRHAASPSPSKTRRDRSPARSPERGHRRSPSIDSLGPGSSASCEPCDASPTRSMSSSQARSPAVLVERRSPSLQRRRSPSLQRRPALRHADRPSTSPHRSPKRRRRAASPDSQIMEKITLIERTLRERSEPRTREQSPPPLPRNPPLRNTERNSSFGSGTRSRTRSKSLQRLPRFGYRPPDQNRNYARSFARSVARSMARSRVARREPRRR